LLYMIVSLQNKKSNEVIRSIDDANEIHVPV
jgi:hypothetical protein